MFVTGDDVKKEKGDFNTNIYIVVTLCQNIWFHHPNIRNILSLANEEYRSPCRSVNIP